MGTIYLPKDALRLIMHISGVSEKVLSKKSKIPLPKIEFILKGKDSQPKQETLKQLSEALGVSLNMLAGNEEIVGAERFIFAERPDNTSEVIKHLMLLMRYTETKLAKESGVSQPLLNRILSDGNVSASFKTLQKLANFFNISIDQLTGRAEINYRTLRDTFYEKVPVIDLEMVPHFLEIHSKVSEWSDNIFVFNPKEYDFCISIEGSKFVPYFENGEKLIFTPYFDNIKNNDVVIVNLEKTKLTNSNHIRMMEVQDNNLVSIHNDEPEFRVGLDKQNQTFYAVLYKVILYGS